LEHGTSPVELAHSDLRLATGALSGGKLKWRRNRMLRRYLLTYPVLVRDDETDGLAWAT
jgi:hypothetical protein